MTLAPSFLAFIAFILPLCAFYAPLALAPLITITALVAVIAGKFKIFPKSFLLWA